MANTIRKTIKSDLEQISMLYEGRKSVDELAWLLRNPKNDADFNSFVAVNENNEVVGAIAYALNNYKYNGRILSGVLPFSWIVKKDSRGLIGIQLILKVLALADFGFAMQGSIEAKKLYSAVKLNHKLNAQIYVKIIEPLKFARSSHRNILINIAKTIYYLPSLPNRKLKNAFDHVKFIEIDQDASEGNEYQNGIFRPVVEFPRIKWILDCPLVDTYGFKIMNKDGKQLGICILYIKKEVNRGKIIYISDLGDQDEHWISSLSHILKFFRKNNCCSVSVLANNPRLVRILKWHRFVKYTQKYSVFVHDKKEVLSEIPLDNWHITYFESDRGYINFNY